MSSMPSCSSSSVTSVQLVTRVTRRVQEPTRPVNVSHSRAVMDAALHQESVSPVSSLLAASRTASTWLTASDTLLSSLRTSSRRITGWAASTFSSPSKDSSLERSCTPTYLVTRWSTLKRSATRPAVARTSSSCLRASCAARARSLADVRSILALACLGSCWTSVGVRASSRSSWVTSSKASRTRPLSSWLALFTGVASKSLASFVMVAVSRGNTVSQ
mmetsp:Transcript_73603/g.225134  ORF Transcript_73603/g.225134 Transcript_73603/m.225134 type:complete len:218 (+) Transcript_73603:497-1150(+)